MASTTASWTNVGSAPSLAAMSVNDTKVISGKWASIARTRGLINSASVGGATTAKAFTVVSAGYQAVKVTRIK